MTGDAKSFIHMTQLDGGSVSFGGKEKGRIVGKGIVKVGQLIVDDVALVKVGEPIELASPRCGHLSLQLPR